VRLYVAGDSPNSVIALANVRSALQAHPDHDVTLEIIDVVRDPELGIRDGVFAFPMLVKIQPLPERRVLGNLKDRRMLLGVLGFTEAPNECGYRAPRGDPPRASFTRAVAS
jgi:circadian clock protein KaiB